LLLQFFHSRGAVLAGRRENMDHRCPNRILGMQAPQEQRQRNGGGMRDDMDCGFIAGIVVRLA
jgi:hypothetical protein